MTTSKTCIVAGIGPGMGMAIARRFAREGYDIAMIARRGDVLDGYKAELEALGVKARPYAADLTDAASVQATCRAILAESGSVDVLVYNGGVWRETKATALEPADFAADMALCVGSALVCAQAVYPGMKAQGHGSILFTGGGLALRPEYGTAVPSLTAGKSALRGLGFAFAPEAQADGIHVGMVTIAGMVKPGTAFDPDRIAEHYWRLHAEKPGAWTVETIFDGTSA